MSLKRVKHCKISNQQHDGMHVKKSAFLLKIYFIFFSNVYLKFVYFVSEFHKILKMPLMWLQSKIQNKFKLHFKYVI